MKTELYKAIKSINIKHLNDDDKKELLEIFMATKNTLIRNHLAFVFADIHYNEAVPFIIKIINKKELFNNNGSLVYSLEDLDTKRYFISLVKIICEQEYEARLIAYGIVQKLSSSISNRIKNKALKILDDYRKKIGQMDVNKGENSSLHFIEKTKELLVVV